MGMRPRVPVRGWGGDTLCGGAHRSTSALPRERGLHLVSLRALRLQRLRVDDRSAHRA